VVAYLWCMSRVLAALCVVIGSGVASAQPSPPPDEPPPSEPPPSEPTTPPVVEPPAPIPPPPPDPIAACKQARHDISVRAESISDPDERGRVMLEMPDCSHFDPVAFAKQQASHPVTELSDSPSYHRTGLAFGVELELAESSLGVPLTSTHVFVGSQGSTALLGFALDLERVSPGGMAPTATIASIGPSLGVTLAHSETGRSELLLGVAASYRLFDHLGALDHRITARTGPSFRYWLSPSFAAAISGNLRYDVLADPSGNSQTVVAVGSALDLVGVF
jgi:hypothetical protein